MYNKSNEGALYNDGTSGEDKSDDAIQQGGTFTYRWTVAEEMGPKPTDAQCLTRMYLSFVNPTKDRYAGMRYVIFVKSLTELLIEKLNRNVIELKQSLSLMLVLFYNFIWHVPDVT